MMEEHWAARLPMGMFSMNVNTGEIRTIHKANDWLNYLLFSPTDPSLLMFCHEGPWHKVDRIWTIRTDGTELTKIHTRTMAMEISAMSSGAPMAKRSGTTCKHREARISGSPPITWIRVSAPGITCSATSGRFTSTSLATESCFGGDPGQVARARDGQWIYLFRPQLIENRGLKDTNFVQPGVLRAERLVNMSKHGYRLEPNVSFTPDQKWVVFRSNMFGRTYVFAVEVDKPATNQTQ